MQEQPAPAGREQTTHVDRSSSDDARMTVATTGTEGGADAIDGSADENPGSLIDHPTDGTDSEDRPTPE